MLRSIPEARAVVALIVAAGVGTWGLHTYPVRPDEVFLPLIQLRTPHVFRVLVYGYAALWFATPYYVASMIASLVTIIVYRRVPAMRSRPLPPYPRPDKRPTSMLVLGETHHLTTPGRAPQPTLLTIAQRGLCTGVMALGAVGTGNTSVCRYPYVDQLLRCRSEDEQRKIGGLVLEVKGDFCGQVRSILSRTGRADDYLEIGLDTGGSYNPLPTISIRMPSLTRSPRC
jgi:hypothetical protein